MQRSKLGQSYIIFFICKFNLMASKETQRQKFESIKSKSKYNDIKMSKDISEILAFIDGSIKKEFQSFSLFSTICGAERRIKINPQFESSFLALSLEEKIAYYETAVDSIIDRQKEASIQFLTDNEVEFDTLGIKVVKGLKPGPSYKIKMQPYVLDCTHYEIGLGSYILRRSKKNKEVFIWESLAQQDPLAIRFEITNYTSSKDTALLTQNYRAWSRYIFGLNRSELQEPKLKLSKKPKENSQAGSPTKKSVEIEAESRSHISPPGNTQEDAVDRSVIQEVFNTNTDNLEEEIYELIEQKELQLSKQEQRQSARHFRKNVARIMLPHLSLVEMENFNDYLPVVRDETRRLYIYQHSSNKSQYRMEMYVRHPSELVVKHLGEVQNFKLWNGSINESHVKLSISSDNAYLAYLKQRSYSKMYRERDFLFLRHLCRVGDSFYFVDCSIENSHFIPFQSIIRGNINFALTKLHPFNHHETRMILELNIDHAGMLLQGEASHELTLNFLKEFAGLESYITRFKGEFKNSFDLNWEISPSNQQAQPFQDLAQSNISVASNLFEQPLSSVSSANNDYDDDFYSIDDNPSPAFEITEEEILKQSKIAKEMQISYTTSQKIDLNQEGLVILPKKYLRIKHAITPMKLQPLKKKNPFKNLMLKNDFVLDNGGGIKLANEIKAAAQNNVIKFIMGTIKKNLFSGKGILNISLPVEIFNCDSNIQRFCQSLSMAPELIQKRKSTTALERFKNCVAFAFTNSVLYFDIDKAFNPILGETFQGFVDGCPIYGEQISHHPPISSIYFVGRGFKIYGNIEAKVYVHLNSGEGVNEGYYTIQFEDGGKVVYQTAPGEVSGLVAGDRKFRFKGKTFVMDAKNRLFCAINFEDESGMFSKNKWQFNDQVEGEIMRVSESFVRNFFESRSGKEAICPGKKEIEERLGKVSGRWVNSFKIDGEEYFSLEHSPDEMVHYEFPLSSNSDYREDLLYRKFNDLARSQSEKQRLEVLQRNDRKLRQKYHGKH